MNYQIIYNKLIEKAKNRKLEGYTETHHIIPKCLGGKDIKENLVDLTAKEHFLCHKLLCEIYPNNHKLLWALWLMAIGKQKWKHRNPYKVTSKDYERARLNYIKISTNRKMPESAKKTIGLKNAKKVYQYSLKKEFIKEWTSANEAERQFHGKPGDNIAACCRNKQHTAYKYIWSYDEPNIYLNNV
jgi:hypothetical protein